jgi:hypothetical protein
MRLTNMWNVICIHHAASPFCSACHHLVTSDVTQPWCTNTILFEWKTKNPINTPILPRPRPVKRISKPSHQFKHQIVQLSCDEMCIIVYRYDCRETTKQVFESCTSIKSLINWRKLATLTSFPAELQQSFLEPGVSIHTTNQVLATSMPTFFSNLK